MQKELWKRENVHEERFLVLIENNPETRAAHSAALPTPYPHLETSPGSNGGQRK